MVQLFIPYFKDGKIASREVFKTSARVFTHALLESSKTPAAEYKAVVKAFFDKSGILYSQSDAEQKISDFKKSFLD